MIFSGACQAVALLSLALLLAALPSALTALLQAVALAACYLYASYQLGAFLDTLPRFRVSAKNKAVLVTGCDTGFGHLLAQRLDSIGYKVYAGCLHAAGAEAQRLRDSCSHRLTVLQLDVTDEASVLQARRKVEDSLDGHELWAIVNNAGVIVRGELEWMPLEDYKKQFEVNTFGTVRVTQQFLPLLRKFKGRVVATTSFGGLYTFPGFAPYCMSKHATNSFCEGLRLEMEKFSVKVVTVQPFAYKSNMTVPSKVIQSVDNTWAKVPKEVLYDYGPGYLDAFKQSVLQFNDFSANPNTHEVVDVLVEATTVTSPHCHYTVGDLRSLSASWFFPRLPLWIRDYILTHHIAFYDSLSRFMQKRGMKLNGKHM